ncbi:hypothetical protein CEP53_003414 [Fusarium sp. AF-6]|nr:hypothetical protein CEP53_003414 [Fusarium sp. AF-6]
MNFSKYIAIILAVLVRLASASDFADWVNDFHSDLAPLVTLLGEKVTMQFIGQAMGPLDCIALALAPLGIITIMVSAIRVGGPTILKAIVGRAKENVAAGELELMSSTSREVCELFNGQNIVRCLGSGSVWQYICLFRKGTGNGQVRFMTLQQATEEGLLTERHGKTAKEPRGNAPRSTRSQDRNNEGEVTGTTTGFASRDRTTLQRMRRRFWKPDEELDVELGVIRTAQEPARETDKGPTEPSSVPEEPSSVPEEHDIGGPATIIVVYDTVPEAPNISLNLQHLGGQTRVWLAVIIGAISQTAVLIIFGLVRFNPGVQTFFKIDKPLPPYGFGLTFTGTLLLAIGVFLCVDVVERSTVEEVYEPHDNFKMRLYWLQQDQTVNDQRFQSFATFSDGRCSRFLKSRRAGTFHRKDTSQGNQAAKKLQTETCVGVGLGLVGFVMQFVGFRGFHPAAPLAQLVAMLIMTVVRAYARPGFTKNLKTAKLLHGFEQDWLAQQLAQYLATQQLVQEPITQQPVQQITPQQLVQPPPQSMDDGNKKQRGLAPWIIVTGREADYRAFKPLDSEAQSQAPDSEAQRLLVMRQGIYKLTKARAISSKCAAKLATAMEKALGVLFPSGPSEGALGFQWVIDVAVKGGTQPAWIDLSYHRAPACWKVKAADLSAVLSLWVYTAWVQENGPRPDDEHGDAEDCAWICKDLSEPSTKALGCRNYRLMYQVMHDLEAQLSRSHYKLAEMMEIWKTEAGEQQKESAPRLEANCARAVSKFADSQDSMFGLYASDLLFSFMWSMAKSFHVHVEGEAKKEQTASANEPPETKHLGNATVTDLISAFREASHWSEHETCLGVISPLSVLGKLPVQPWYHTMSEAIMDALRSKERGLIHVAMSQAIQKAESLILTYKAESTGLHERGLVWLLEHRGHTTEVPWAFRFGIMLQETPMGCASQENIRHLSRLVSGSDALSEHLAKLWANQGRRQSQPRQITSHKELPACFSFTALHEEAVRGNEIGGDASAELKALVNVQDICGWTPLFYAASVKNWKMVEQLLALKADATLADIHGYTAVHYACLSGCRKTLGILVRHGVKWDSQAINGALPIHLAAGRGHSDVITYFYQLQWMLNRVKPEDPILDFNNRTPMHWAAVGGHIQAVEALGDDVNAQDDCGWSPLHAAILSGRGHVVSTLCQLSADMESRDFKGRTPLLLACAERKWETIRELIDIGAKVHAADSDDMTPLHYLASKVDDATLISTLTKGLDDEAIQHLTELRNRDGRTPLHVAAMRGELDIINKLLELGADSDLIDEQGKSPLFLALVCANWEDVALQIAKVLVRGGNWLRVRSVDGRSILDVAKKQNLPTVVKFLEAERERLERET